MELDCDSCKLTAVRYQSLKMNIFNIELFSEGPPTHQSAEVNLANNTIMTCGEIYQLAST